MNLVWADFEKEMACRLGARYCGARPRRRVPHHPQARPLGRLRVSPPGLAGVGVLLRRLGRLDRHRAVWLDVLMSEIHGHHCFAVVFLLR